MHKFYLLLIPILLVSCSNQDKVELTQAKKGIIDLREWDFENSPPIALDGEWEFYWENLIISKDLNPVNNNYQKEYIQVPKSWAGTQINGKTINQFGYATYRLKILLNNNAPKRMAFTTMSIPTASKIFLNNKLIATHGIVAKTDKQTKPGFVTKLITFVPKTDTLDLIIQVSNFQFYKAGLAYKIEIGELSITNQNRTRAFGFKLFILGALIIMAFFFLGFYIYRPIDKSSLYFGLFTLSVSLYSFFVSIPHLVLFESLPFDFQTNIIRYTSYLFPILMVLFFKESFPHEHKKWSVYIFGSTSFILILLTIVLPIPISSPLMKILWYTIILSLIYILYRNIIAIINKRLGAKIIFTGFIVLFLCITNDVLHHAQIIRSVNLLDVGLTSFIAIMAYYLSAKFAAAFNKNEKLSIELNESNKELENRVIERTSEINSQKEEILTQTEQLRITNQKLIELDGFKNSTIHMIVHDLKNPLNVIYSLPEILEEGDSLDIIKKAGQQMLHLVSNILDVQKYEQSKMELNIQNTDISKVVDEAINQTKYLVGEKGIHVINEISDATNIPIDKEVIERVFVNLLSNSIKFTPHNGRITIACTDKKNEMLKISVEDTGEGIQPEMLENIFDQYVQAVAKNSGHARSTGLGLTFCKLAIESHEGEIWAESPANKGAIFNFTLPLKQ